MNRLKTLLLSLVVIGSGAFVASVDLTPPPPPVAAVAQTPESIKEGIRQEKLQIRYDKAEVVAARVMRRNGCGTDYAQAVAHAAVDHGVSAVLLSAVAVVESTCRPNLISKTHDVGLLQVNIRTHRRWSLAQLLNPYTNAQAGAEILATAIHKYGVFQGLHAYNGFGNPTDDYALMVYHKAGIKPPQERTWAMTT